MTKEAAEVLGISRSHLSARVAAGTVARVPHIGAILIPAREVDRMLNGEEP